MLNTLALKLIAGIAAILMLVVLVQDRNRWKARSAELQRQLTEISTKRNEQRKETVRTITVAEKVNREAERRAERVEAAPLPGQCRTPSEVLQAGL